jgi:hypothetical protein
LCEQEDEFQRRRVQIFAVTFESRRRTREYQRKERLPFPLLRDPRRTAYERFGIERRSGFGILQPATIVYYIKRFLQGQMPARVKADPYQLGGDVLIDVDGIVLWVYRSSQPADRPSVDAILREIDRAGV